MKAVVITRPGEPQVLEVKEVEDPKIGENEVLIKISATALNRADTLQRKGAHPPPPGASPYLGLECSGTVESVGYSVTRWNIGDQVEDPKIGENKVLIKASATGLNRADTLQRKGAHPPPPGASTYLGLECSGTVEGVGRSVTRWNIGDQVCALLSGGGYAEKVAVPAGQVLPVPEGISITDAASFPEVACTVWSTVFMMSRLSPGETFLIHGGSSGIGTFAIQIAKYRGVKVFVTAGSEEKLAACKELGADVGINYKTEDFVARVKEETQGKGVDVILDNVGGPYFQRNLESLNVDGRLFIIGFMGGAVTQANLAIMLGRRLTVQAAGLRNRSLGNKAEIVSEVEKNVWPAIAAGKVKPIVYKHFPLSEAAEGHRLMEASTHIGKILLIP